MGTLYLHKIRIYYYIKVKNEKKKITYIGFNGQIKTGEVIRSSPKMKIDFHLN